MAKDLFEDFKNYVEEVFGCEVLKTTPEKAIRVGDIEENFVLSNQSFFISLGNYEDAKPTLYDVNSTMGIAA